MSPVCSLLHKGARRCRTGEHGDTMQNWIPIFFSSCGKENGHSWSKEKTLRDDLTLLCQITRNGGWLSRTSDQIRKSYRLRETCSVRHCVPAPVGTPHTGAANRTPPTSLSAAAPPSCPGRGFQRGGPQPAPLCRFKGVRGEIEIPPRFPSGEPGGTFSFQKRISPLASRLGNRGRPLRQRPLPLAPTWECPLAGASPPPCRIAAHL